MNVCEDRLGLSVLSNAIFTDCKLMIKKLNPAITRVVKAMIPHEADNHILQYSEGLDQSIRIIAGMEPKLVLGLPEVLEEYKAGGVNSVSWTEWQDVHTLDRTDGLFLAKTKEGPVIGIINREKSGAYRFVSDNPSSTVLAVMPLKGIL